MLKNIVPSILLGMFITLVLSSSRAYKNPTEHTNGLDRLTSKTYSLVNTAPVFESSSITSVTNSQFYNYQLFVTDVDKNFVLLTAPTLPSWLSLNQNNLLLGKSLLTTNIVFVDAKVDASGNIYFIEDNASSSAIKVLKTDGTVDLLAGSLSANGFVDANGENARFNSPSALAIDDSGNVYVADSENKALRKVDVDGNVTTLIGTGGSVDNTPLNNLRDVESDASGNIYFSFENENSPQINKLSGGTLSAFASSPYQIKSMVIVENNEFWAIAQAADDILFNVVDGVSEDIWNSQSDGRGEINGSLSSATFNSPQNISVDRLGRIFLTDSSNENVRMIDQKREVSTVLEQTLSVLAHSSGRQSIGINGSKMFDLISPGFSLSGDPSGQVGDHNVVLRADDGNGGITDQSFTITVTNSSPSFTSTPTTEINNNLDYRYKVNWTDDDFNLVEITAPTLPAWLMFELNEGAAVSTFLNSNSATGLDIDFALGNGFAYDNAGNLYTISNNQVIKINPDGEGIVLSGTGASGYVDGAGDLAIFGSPNDLVIDSNGVIYVNDQQNSTIRKVEANGNTSTFLNFNNTSIRNNIWIDNDDNIFLASSNQLFKVSANGQLNLVAGTGNTGKEDGLLQKASFNQIRDVYIDELGIIFIADAGNDLIRKIDLQGNVSTIAGSVQGDVNGTALNARFDEPTALIKDKFGNLYISDQNNHKIKVLNNLGEVSTFAGSTQGDKNGVGEQAQLSSPQHLTFSPNGDLLFLNSSELKSLSLPVYFLSGDPSRQLGDHNVVLHADDGQGGSATQEFTVSVTNEDPVFNSTPVTEVQNSVDYSYEIDIIDPDLNPISLENSNLPSWLNIVETEGGSTSRLFESDNNQLSIKGVTSDADENVYFIQADENKAYIKKWSEADGITILAGQEAIGFDNGVGAAATFDNPNDLAVDADGNVYVSDSDNHAIRKITSDGTVTTLVGNGTEGSSNGAFSVSTLSFPLKIEVDQDGNLLVLDNQRCRIRKVDLINETVETKNNIREFRVGDFSIDPLGNIYATNNDQTVDIDRYALYKIDTSANTTLLWSNDNQGVFNTGVDLGRPEQVAVSRNGQIFLSDNNDIKINLISPNLSVIQYSPSSFNDIIINERGNLLLTDYGSVKESLIPRKVLFGDPSGQVGDHNVVLQADDSQGGIATQTFTISVTNEDPVFTSTPITVINNDATYRYEIKTSDADFNPVEVNATTKPDWLNIELDEGGNTSLLVGNSNSGTLITSLSAPTAVVLDSEKNMYIAVSGANKIIKVTPNGEVSDFAGNGTSGYVDGVGINAQFNSPTDMIIDSDGNLYVSERENHTIRKITPEAIVSTYVGGNSGFKDGHISEALISFPRGLDIDESDNIYLADVANRRVRKITPEGQVTTLAGTGGFGTQNGGALNATFANLADVALGNRGEIYIADTENHLIRMLKDGIVSTVAGSTQGYQDGEANSAKFEEPWYLETDRAGNLYIGENGKHTIRVFDTEGNVLTFIGSTNGYREGNKENALVTNPVPSFINSDGDLLFIDDFRRIRKVTTPDLILTGDPTMAVGDYNVELTATDGQGGTSSQAFTISVNDVLAPVITSDSDITVDENSSGTFYTLMAEDAQAITYTIGTEKDEALFSFDDATGELSFLGASDYEDPQDANKNNVYELAIDATDGTNSTTFYLMVRVNNLQDEDVIFTSTPITQISNNSSYTLEVKAIDPDGEPVEITAPTVPDWLNLSVNHEDKTISEFTGTGSASTMDGDSETASFESPRGVMDIDKSGNIYIIDNQVLRKVLPNGSVVTLAGTGDVGYVDGEAALAQFSNPGGLAVGPSGKIYIAEISTQVIRVYDPITEMVSTFAGDGRYALNDGPLDQASFANPGDIAFDRNGNMFVADIDNDAIRKITPEGNVSTFAGTGSNGYDDGVGTNASFRSPRSLVFNKEGDLFVVEQGNYGIRRIKPDGTVEKFVGSGSNGNEDGEGTSSSFENPFDISIGRFGNFYVTDLNGKIRKISPEGNVTTVYDNQSGGTNPISSPLSIVINNEGDLIISDQSNYKLFRLRGAKLLLQGDPSGQVGDHNVVLQADDSQGGITTQAFTISVTNEDPIFTSTPITGIDNDETYRYEIKTSDADGNPVEVTASTKPDWLALESDPGGVTSTIIGETIAGSTLVTTLSGPNGMAYDSQGNLFIVEAFAHRIVKIDTEGNAEIFAGTGSEGFSDGQGTAASFSNPFDIVIDSNDNIFVTEVNNNAIRKITPDGSVSKYIGDVNGEAGSIDGNGTNATLSNPRGIAIDGDDNLYFINNNSLIRKATPQGEVSTISGQAGIGNKDGSTNDATFRYPIHLAVDVKKNIYIADRDNHSIRKISFDGIVSTIAGSTQGFNNGASDEAQFSLPHGIEVDIEGRVYVSEEENRVVRIIETDGTVSTLAGSGENTYVDDTGINAAFGSPQNMIFNGDFDLLVTDGTNRIRKVTTPDLIFTGDPLNEVGDYEVELSATDGQGGSASQAFTISVNDVVAPVLTSTSEISVDENTSTSFYTLTAEDAQAITYTIGTEKDEALFSFDAATGELSFLTAPDHENAVDADGDNIYELSIGASDGVNSTTFDLTVEVNNLQDEAPVFTSVAITSVNNNEAYTYNIQSIDPDGGDITLTTSDLPSWLSLTDNGGGMGVLNGDATNEFGAYEIELVSTDPSNTSTAQSFTITVNDVVAPVLTSTTEISVDENISTSFYTLTAEDAQAISYTIGTEKDEALFSFDAVTGELSFLTAPDHENAVDADGDNIYELYINASDGVNNATFDLTVEVNNLQDEDPTFTSSPVIKAVIDESYRYEIAANDPDGSTVSFVALDLPTWLSLTDNMDNTGTLIGTPTLIGDFNVSLEINDGINQRVQQNFTIVVSATPPEITSATEASIEENTSGTVYTITATDPSTITYSLGENKDESLFAVDSNTGEVSFNSAPNFEDPQDADADNTYEIEVSASNADASASLIVSIAVTNVSDVDPVFDSSPIATVNDNAGYRYDISVSDGDGEVPQVSASTLPSWLSLTSQVEGQVSVAAGNISSKFKDGNGANASFDDPNGVAIDSEGNLYIADTRNHRIRKITPSGDVSTFTGNGKAGYKDGIGLDASFNNPIGLVFNSQGDLFVTDTGNNRIRKISSNGEVTTFAGSGESQLLDGVGTNAAFRQLVPIVIDEEDNLYVGGQSTVRKVTPGAEVTTYAGNENFGDQNANGTAAGFANIRGLAIGNEGNLYTGEVFAAKIRKIDTNRDVSFLAGSGTREYADGIGAEASFSQIESMTMGPDGQLYVSSDGVRRVNVSTGEVERILGASQGNQDGTGVAAQFGRPSGLAFGSEGDLFIADRNNSRIRKADSGLTTSTIAGGAIVLYTDGPLNETNFHLPFDVAVSNDGITYIASAGGPLLRITQENVLETVIGAAGSDVETIAARYLHFLPNNELLITNGFTQIYKLTTDGRIVLFAGTSAQGNTDGDRLQASFTRPSGMTSDSDGNIYLADERNSTIRKIDVNGIVSTLAGSGTFDVVDGQGSQASFRLPIDITFASDGNLYVADAGGNAIRKVTLQGEVTTVLSGQNNVFLPRGIISDQNGDLYISVNGRDQIKKLTLSGELTTVVGNSYRGFKEGVRTEASINQPWGLAFDNNGDLLIADSYNHMIRRLSANGGLFLEGSAIGQSGTHDVVLEANDQNGGVTQQSFTIEVVDVTAPVFTSVNSVQVNENDGDVFYTTQAEDTNSFVLAKSGGDDSALFTFNDITGELSFIESPDFENPSDDNGDNTYLIEITAQDESNNSTILQLSVEVQDVDPEAILRVEGDVKIPPTALGFTSDFSVLAHNDGGAALTVSQITYPEAFSGPTLPLSIEPGSSALLGFKFNPTEQKVYSGDIVISTNGGIATLAVSANGEIITSSEESALDQNVRVYPNPSKGEVLLDLSKVQGSQIAVSWFSSKGILLGNNKSSETMMSIDLTQQPDGLVLIKVSIDDKVIFKKVMIKK